MALPHTVIIQVIHYKWDNSFLGGFLKRYPTLFHGVCRVNPEDAAAPDELARLLGRRIQASRISPAADASRRLDSWAADAAALAQMQ